MTGSARSWIDGAAPYWTRGRLKDLVAGVVNGVWGDDAVGDDSDVNCIRAADFDRARQRINLEGVPRRSVEDSVLRRHLLRPGDLVLEKSGGGEKQPVGAAILFDLPGRYVCTNFCARVIPAAHTESRFLAYVFSAVYGQGLTQSVTKQTTGIQNLNGDAFFGLPWAYPELEEQRCIADFLNAETSRIDRIAGHRVKQLCLLAERERAVIDRTLVREYDSTITLARVCRIRTGVTVDGGRSVPGGESRPYIRVANVKADGLDLSEVKSIQLDSATIRRTQLRVGDVLMTEGGDIDKLGRGTLWSGEVDGCLHQNHVFAVRPGPRLLGEYLALLTRTSSARSYFEMTGSKTTNLASTSTSKILAFSIPLPDRREQAQRVRDAREAIASIVHLRQAIDRQRALLAERRQALITAVVTGQLDVTTARSGVRV